MTMSSPIPTPGSPEEHKAFAALQARLPALYQRVFPHRLEPRTVVVLPSLTFDSAVIERLTGLPHYEERLLCMLMLLRLPRTRVIYLTSTPLHSSIVDYYLHLLTGVPSSHARRRLVTISCHDATQRTLTSKLLERPRLMDRIREAIGDPHDAHLSCFTVNAEERTLAVQLGIPIYGCDPALADLGSKSGSREIFREAGVPLPDGRERLRDVGDVAEALAELRGRDPELRRAVVKLEEGVSGEGNAVFRFEGAPSGGPGLQRWIEESLPKDLRFESDGMNWDLYSSKYAEMGGIVEAWLEGDRKTSPSGQGRIDPLGSFEMISTHDQILGGPSGQVFKGCTFPAAADYRLDIQDITRRVGEVLAKRGALGRFGVDVVSVPRGTGWEHRAIEINLRKGGTTHPFQTLEFLTDGRYDEETGTFRIPTGQERAYFATDNLYKAEYRRLTPVDLVDVVVDHELHFHGATQNGVVFHMLGALAGYGKLGMVCVDETTEKAEAMYDDTVQLLDRAAAEGMPEGD